MKKTGRRGTSRERSKQAASPQSGAAGRGQAFDPTARAADDEPGPSRRAIRSAPAPGVPMSEEHYNRLKELARNVGPSKQVSAQRDMTKKHR